MVLARPGIDQDMLRQDLDDMGRGVGIVAAPGAAMGTNTDFLGIQMVTNMVGAIVVLAALVLVFHTMAMATAERRRAIALSRTRRGNTDQPSFWRRRCCRRFETMRVGRRIEAAWTAFVLAVIVFGLATSEGEPVCEGPFITGADDSLPPQCGSPLDVVPVVVIGWGVVLVAILAVRALARHETKSG